MYLVIISSNSNKRPPGLIAPPFIIGFLATENLLKVSFKHCSKSLKWALGSNIWPLLTKIHMKS